MTGKAVEPDSARQGVVWTPERAAEHVRAAYGREVEAVLATGHALAEAKGRLPHGQWAAAVALMPFSERTAQRYMRVAANNVLSSNTPHVAVLPSSVHTLDLLAELSPADLAAALADGTVSAEMTREDARALVRAAGAGKPQIPGGKGKGKPEPVTARPGTSSAGKPGTGKNTATPASSPSSPVQPTVRTGTGTTGTGAAPTTAAEPGPEPEPDPQPCPRCAPQVAHLEQLADDLGAELEKAHAEAERLGRIRPDVVMAAELAAVAEDRDRLAVRVAELEARLSAAPVAAEQDDPGNDTDEPGSAADGGVCEGCGGPGAPAWSLQGSGARGEHVVCGRCLEKARQKFPGVVFSREELLGVSA